jgi:hypothetical protein
MNSNKSGSLHSIPEYWNMLNDDDKKQYRQLRKLIDPLSLRTTRDQLPVKFQIVLSEIQRYSIRSNGDDWRRCVACGIVWLDDALAISTRQLRALIGKCKSSINAGFQSLGYVPSPMSSYHASQLMGFLPFLPQNSSDFRQWTIRVLAKSPLTSPFGEPVKRELADGASFTETIDSFDLTYQVLREQEALALEMDHHFPMQPEPNAVSY